MSKTEEHNERRRMKYEKRPEMNWAKEDGGLTTTQIAEELGCSRINVCHLTKTAYVKIAQALLKEMEGPVAAKDHNRVMNIIKEPAFLELVGDVLREKPVFSKKALKKMENKNE